MSAAPLDVMCVEDSPELRLVWRRLFQAAGYHLRQFETAQAALASIEADGAPDVLITDYFLPDMNGLDLLREARSRQPGLPGILVTGNREDELGRTVASIERLRYLPKPVKFKVLEQAIGELLGTTVPPLLPSAKQLDSPSSGA
jgi:CheY-like chemotaxis protein